MGSFTPSSRETPDPAAAAKGRPARHLLPAAAFALLGVAFVGYGAVSKHRAAPGPEVRTLDDFLRWRPDTERFRVLSAGEQEYLGAYRTGGGFVPSGPATYIFDRRGRLVDWTRDAGGDARFHGTWSWLRPVREFDAAAARRWVSPRGDDPQPAGDSPG